MPPPVRIRAANAAGIRAKGRYVLYWVIATRRATWNHALDHAIASARELGVPVLVFEPLRTGYAWACDRFHAFALQGMADNARAFASAGLAYFPYVEPTAGGGRGLLAALAARARLVVTDEQPGFFQPRMVAAAAERLDVRLDVVDSCGVLPLRAVDRAYPTAASFRRQLQKTLLPHLLAPPASKLERTREAAEVPAAVTRKWPPAALGSIELARLPIDHAIAPVGYRGGARAAQATLSAFLERKLPRYAEERSDPDADVASGLSPYLHFGHISAHDIALRVLEGAAWDPARLADAKVTGSREGWWGVPANEESFLDELITWRELGYGFCYHRADFDRWTALPPWARATLDEHARDPRPERYTRRELEEARTGDELWNAAQRELVADGRIHNYLRMLWGKKILEWSSSPRARDADRAQQQVRRRRPRSEFLQRHPVDPRPVRSRVGTGAGDLRNDPLHVVGSDQAQAEAEALPRALALTLAQRTQSYVNSIMPP